MRNFFCWTIGLLLSCMISLQAAAQHLLSGKYTTTQLERLLIPRTSWTPFPPAGDAAWAAIDREQAAAIIKKATGYLHYEWPGIPATTSLLIVRTGNRSDYQAIANRKREALATLLLAEILEHKGRFTDDIINGVWSVCEESFWGASAHLPKGKDYAGLPDVSSPFVELFSAETATLLAWVDYYVGDQLDAVSPQIRKRIYEETDKRIFQPLMTKHHGWMGNASSGRRPNNWNPWICSNWLNAVLLLEKDEHKRISAVQHILLTLDNFLDPYPADGGCDEGPGYWGAAAASLFDNISLLDLATHHAFNYVFQDDKVRKMGQFIYQAQISERYFLDFADADPQPGMDGMMIYRFGKAIADTDMMRFGAYYFREDRTFGGNYHFFRNFFSLFLQQEVKATPKGLPMPQNVWWPDLQVMVARDHGGNVSGFYVAAKGGSNDESHNHNDVGNYIVYYDGLPVIIDVGRGTYTARTFSDKRYDIWFNRSDYHNLPDVNGYTQLPGPRYKATQVEYKSAAGYSQLSLDLTATYPEAAGIEQWKRSIRLNRRRSVQIEDQVSLKAAGTFIQHLMTCYPVSILQPGKLVIHTTSRDFMVSYPARQLEASVEKVTLQTMEDQGIRQKWGDNIYRVSFKCVAPVIQARSGLTVTTR
ncbi:heparinase II/III family protein [Chitinophaga sp. HK235]|uniref:heparinase II/III family protein n=1 Tax=Chitinophaga sp. HK235 TaxID=2952571 RepID=UPI001BACD1C9|nr:heparinase II/III family protein [Chitinophaga sp. HK235]